jgi:hypothetical protein
MKILGDRIGFLMRPQLLEGLKFESQTENNEKGGNWGTLPSSQHYRGVERRARTPRWD